MLAAGLCLCRCLLESRGAQYAAAAQESYVAAWQLEPSSERYATTAFLVLRATRPPAELQTIAAQYARSDNLANFRAWETKTRRANYGSRGSSKGTCSPRTSERGTAAEDATADLSTAAAVLSAGGRSIQLNGSLLAIEVEAQHAETRDFVKTLKAFMRESATPATCALVRASIVQFVRDVFVCAFACALTCLCELLCERTRPQRP